MILPLLICAMWLSACAPSIKTYGKRAVEEPYIPHHDTLTNGEVGDLLFSQQAALKQCNANFEE